MLVHGPLELMITKPCPKCGNEMKRTLHSVLARPKTICVCGTSVIFQTRDAANLLDYLDKQLTDLEKRIDDNQRPQ